MTPNFGEVFRNIQMRKCCEKLRLGKKQYFFSKKMRILPWDNQLIQGIF